VHTRLETLRSGGFCCPRLHRYYGLLRLPLGAPSLHGFSPLIEFAVTGRPGVASSVPEFAGAKTDLSCSMVGCVIVPLPQRRRVLRCCASKVFAPSMAFAREVRARLPLVPANAGFNLTTRQSDSSTYGPITRSPPKAASSWRFDGRISPSAGHQLRGCLVTTPTGPSPASPPQPQDTRLPS